MGYEEDRLKSAAICAAARNMSEAEIDYNVMGTFPASDPPSWTLGISPLKKTRNHFKGEQTAVNEPSHQNLLAGEGSKEEHTMSSSSQQRTSPTNEPVGELEPVAYFHGAMLTGASVSHEGRIFVNFPKWGDDVKFTVAEIRDGEAVAYPDEAFNQTDENDPAAALVSVQSVVVDPADRLWILDTGSPLFKPTEYGGRTLAEAVLRCLTAAATSGD